MKIKANTEELWDFIVYLYHMKTNIQTEVERRKRQLAFYQEKLIENQLSVERQIKLYENRDDGADYSRELGELYEHLLKIKKYRSQVECLISENVLEKNLSEVCSSLSNAINKASRYLEYLEELDFDYAYGEYKKNVGSGQSTQIKYRGCNFKYDNDNFDFDFKDKRGKTNLERMKKGYSPIGHDGMYINLHHTTQQEKGGIVEIQYGVHKKNHKIIHINPSTIPSGIDRAAFGRLRGNYWKLRAKFEERRRREI